jgi:hypothetical protein
MVEEILQDAAKELSRADHSIAVSLKYTRTVDVIKSIIERLINSVNLCFDALLTMAQEEGKIEEVPKVPRLKVAKVSELYGEEEMVQDFCDFFFLLRKVNKARFERAQEYRRHVTMTAHMEDGDSVQVTIDIITDYFDRTKEFLNLVQKIRTGPNE